jgi:uncharacterized membrane protein SpoIIM required for sporulation
MYAKYNFVIWLRELNEFNYYAYRALKQLLKVFIIPIIWVAYFIEAMMRPPKLVRQNEKNEWVEVQQIYYPKM